MGDGHFYVYILASQIGGTLYIGVTNDLVRRVRQHREGVVEGFTQKYDVHRLVYFEQFDDIENAIRREKQLKKWNRGRKNRLIEENNPNWDDLYPGLLLHNTAFCSYSRASSDPCGTCLDGPGGWRVLDRRLRGR